MSDKIVVLYRETRIVRLDEDVEITGDTPEGITVRHTYRKGKRLEFIPREKLEGIVYEDIKPTRSSKKAKVAAKPKKEVVELVIEGDVTVEGTVEPSPNTLIEEEPAVTEEDASGDIFSESEDYDDGEDDYDDDEFED